MTRIVLGLVSCFVGTCIVLCGIIISGLAASVCALMACCEEGGE